MSFESFTPTPVALPSGIILNYVRAGSGLPLIFIHGAMGDWRSWGPQWASFTARYDCISYSRRYSHPNPNPMTARDHSALVDAEDLLGLMDALGLAKAVLVGSSYGGFTALALALHAPGRVAAVVAVEPPMMRYADATADGAAVAAAFRKSTVLPARAAFERGDDAEGAAILTGGIGGPRARPMRPEMMARRMQNLDAAKSLSLSDDEFPLFEADRLAGLPMPVFLLSGMETAPIHAAIFAGVTAAMPNARIRKIAGSGHSVSQQKPDVFNTEVLGFLTEHGIPETFQPA